MKRIKKWVSVLLVLSVMISLLVISEQETQAAAKASVAKAVHLNVGAIHEDTITIYFAHAWDHVENLKTSSKNLKAKITSVSIFKYNQGMNSTSITLYTNKKGTYTVSFDICDESGKTVSSHKVKVYANTDRAIKSVTYAGKQAYGFTDKAKGKLAVTMNKGYTLKKIVLETYDKAGEQKMRTVKNNSTVELGKYPYFYENGEMYKDHYNMRTLITATTGIRVYYIDKYTKEETSEYYQMYCLAQ